jgi:hypothetical protein
MICAAAALAIQPDRAMAGMLAAGLTVFAVMRPDRLIATALAGSIIGFAVTLTQADTLAAMPSVEKVYNSSYNVHAFAGAAVLGGSILVVLPAIVGWYYDEANRNVYSVFGIVWFEAMLAAALGNFPTPVVGYGGSAIIGYVVSLTMLPKFSRARRPPAMRLSSGP